MVSRLGCKEEVGQTLTIYFTFSLQEPPPRSPSSLSSFLGSLSQLPARRSFDVSHQDEYHTLFIHLSRRVPTISLGE